jgi:cytochrome c
MKASLIAIAAFLAIAGNASASQDLAKAKNCMGCHDMEKKRMGPSLKDIANKYKGDAKAEAYLTEVNMKGGKGVWGVIPMPAQKITPEEATTLAKWILSL